MLKELASEASSISYAVLVLILFVAFFAGTLVWVYRKSGKAEYDRLSRLPLKGDDEDVVKPHDFDGIREYDNRLPRWWLGTFVITVVFGLGYWFYYHVTSKGADAHARYELQVKELRSSASRAAEGTAGDATDETLVALSKNPQSLALAQTTFMQNCLACHGAQAQGVIGPNLTDEYWINGGKPTQILATIENGVAAKGMLAWKGVLKPEQIQALVGYIISLQGSNPPGAKEPQGEKVQ